MSKTKRKKKSRAKLSLQEIEKRKHKKEIISTLLNMGFKKVQADNIHFSYKEVKGEIDDIYFSENVILLLEYTIEKSGDHFKKKAHLYNKISENYTEFIKYLISDESCFYEFKEIYKNSIKAKYHLNQLKIRIVYCSKNKVSSEHRLLSKNVKFYDISIIHYFKYLSNALKISARNEFLDFLDINCLDFGDNIFNEEKTSKQTFNSHVLPEAKSHFKNGYKIVSFYIDPDSLLKRAYVLRQEGWRDEGSTIVYQRMVDSKKILKMRKYLSEEERVFVNNIIVTIDEKYVKLFDEHGTKIDIDKDGNFDAKFDSSHTKLGSIEIQNHPNIIGIIDGQHRIFAYHEGNDQYENSIVKLRKRQNLLVTGILFPINEPLEKRRIFEAILFREINNNQTKIHSQLQQELDLIVSPFSTTAIGKLIVIGLNKNGPLENKLELHSYETQKVKTASLVSFGLKPLIKFGDKTHDSLFSIWDNPNKIDFATSENLNLREEYVNFCVEKIRDIFIALKDNMPSSMWNTYNPQTREGCLSITFINGILNVLRCIIKNQEKLPSIDEYRVAFKNIKEFNFRNYKSSHYTSMGKDIYKQYLDK